MCVDGQEIGCAAEEDGEEIEGDHGEDDFVIEDVLDAGDEALEGGGFAFIGGGAFADGDDGGDEDDAAEGGDAVGGGVSPGDEDTGECGAGHGGGFESSSVPGDGVVEDFFGDERGEKCGAGGPADGFTDGGEEDDGIDGPEWAVVPGEDAKRDGASGGEELGDDHDAAAVHVVGELAGGEREENDGEGADEADPAEGHGALGALVEIPADGDFEDLAADDGGDPTDEIKAEIAEAKGGIGIVAGRGAGLENFRRRCGGGSGALIVRIFVGQLGGIGFRHSNIAKQGDHFG